MKTVLVVIICRNAFKDLDARKWQKQHNSNGSYSQSILWNLLVPFHLNPFCDFIPRSNTASYFFISLERFKCWSHDIIYEKVKTFWYMNGRKWLESLPSMPVIQQHSSFFALVLNSTTFFCFSAWIWLTPNIWSGLKNQSVVFKIPDLSLSSSPRLVKTGSDTTRAFCLLGQLLR